MALQMSCQNIRQKLVDLSDDGGEKWFKYYSSHHQILLVDEVVRKYKKAMSNLIALTKMGACVLHGVDATQMKFHPYLEMRRFDRIIFNFPHAGFHGKESNFSMIQKHKDLVRGFFMNAGSMLRSNGEIHVNHKTKPPYDAWRIKELGIQNFLWPIECVQFKKEDYPGYNNKRGDGSRSDEPFHLGKCSTFKFALLTKNEFYPTNQRTLSYHHYPLISLTPHSPPSAKLVAEMDTFQY
ncbi:heavy metal-associated isoprenylated plant protein 41-like isoform X2 [Neltuma alba]|uniref:heavy metal-associated isoprenylated plant protein 41-like isoform X2 n=1 Tax=Neltuma alba TaxID=207710 RepID=UPI0010A33755|nr:heavy metal-associated isoprenylated plant protein 41-like isoform X2 [Prosopis alba]